MLKKSYIPALAAVVAASVWAFSGDEFVLPKDSVNPAEHRFLNFDEIHNFRDLGGYRTADNQQVKWGVLYRTAKLVDASDEDLARMQTLGLYELIDFRGDDERADEPDRLPANHRFNVKELPFSSVTDPEQRKAMESFKEKAKNFELAELLSQFNVNDFMLDINRRMVSGEQAVAFREFIQSIIAADGKPVVWHCTAGKDRTGFAAAILLRILGVPMDTIYQDYLLSNKAQEQSYKYEITYALYWVMENKQVASELVRLMGSVEKPWLEAAFAEIDKDYGSFDAYVHDFLGLSEADISKLKSVLLEPVPA